MQLRQRIQLLKEHNEITTKVLTGDVKPFAKIKILKQINTIVSLLGGMNGDYHISKNDNEISSELYQTYEKPTITRRQKDNDQAVALMRELQQQNRQATDLAKIPANTTVWELNANQGLFIDLAMFDNRLRGI